MFQHYFSNFLMSTCPSIIALLKMKLMMKVAKNHNRFGIQQFLHIEARIAELGYNLPPIPPTPKGSYNNFIKRGNMLYISGHLPQPVGGDLIKGRLGENMNVEEGKHAARLAALQLLASVKKACNNDLDNVVKVIKVTGFVNSTNDFTSQAIVLNGCSGQHFLPTFFISLLQLLQHFCRSYWGNIWIRDRSTFEISSRG